jgi:hypothetical protein
MALGYYFGTSKSLPEPVVPLAHYNKFVNKLHPFGGFREIAVPDEQLKIGAAEV